MWYDKKTKGIGQGMSPEGSLAKVAPVLLPKQPKSQGHIRYYPSDVDSICYSAHF